MIDSIILPKAQIEILDAWEWYEDKKDGLGDRFEEEVIKKIRKISKAPLIYQKKSGLREAKVDVFPYLIIFKVNKKANLLFVVSVFHMSRHPKRKAL